ncbi:ATP-dependent RNA helicase DBP2 [Pelomyxa schiedti]|nr:ATP-dependent RNA helicase DBP2 [Pelomyxa schiedti]
MNRSLNFIAIKQSSEGGVLGSKRIWGVELDNDEEERIAWNLDQLPKFKKEFYRENPNVTAMKDVAVERYRSSYNMTLSGKLPWPKPVLSFSDVGFPPAISNELCRGGFREPTPIQAQAWPCILSGRDVVACAETGSGKTLAFLLPGITHVMAQGGATTVRPVVLVLAPTRELVSQTYEMAVKFGTLVGVSCACVYGGVPKHKQANDLKRGPHILVAAPGRLIDFLEAGVTTVAGVTFLVLDEADHMLDLGFGPQIHEITRKIRPDRQTVMCTATWLQEVEDLAENYLTNCIHINIGSEGLRACHDIKQIIKVCSEEEKKQILLDLLHSIDIRNSKVLIFSDTKRVAEDLCTFLSQQHFPALLLHGDKQQQERESAFQDFKKGAAHILVATDVAARGLDVKGITHVINFDFPRYVDVYVHRIGRTGRAGVSGVAVSFFTRENALLAGELISILNEAEQEVPPALKALIRGTGSSAARNWADPSAWSTGTTSPTTATAEVTSEPNSETPGAWEDQVDNPWLSDTKTKRVSPQNTLPAPHTTKPKPPTLSKKRNNPKKS